MIPGQGTKIVHNKIKLLLERETIKSKKTDMFKKQTEMNVLFQNNLENIF